jgi:GNAT superfamily N-acetyltransferase
MGSFPSVTLRALAGEAREMADLQRVMEAAPGYAALVTGGPPGRADAQSTFTYLPDGKTYDDKFVYGIYLDDRMVGCVDLIRGYPDEATAFLGLVLISEPFQRRGLGSAAIRAIERIVWSWGSCNRIRLSVLRVNDQVVPFWTSLGFEATGETKPYAYGAVASEHVLYEKRLRQ